MRNGHGELTLADGDKYVGQFVDDQMSGHGVLTFTDGRVYSGSFVDDKMHGEGELKKKNGKVTKGVWRDGVKLTRKQELEAAAAGMVAGVAAV